MFTTILERSNRCRLKFDTFSKNKYYSVISQNGGWQWFQSLLQVLQEVAMKHNSSIANVSCRWVLDKPAVAGIIVGARNANHVADHVKLASLRLDDEDLGRIDEVLDSGRQATGDCYDWERGGVW
jgi:aryl-alcohol dehydrogenase-like predicted oxidoreductase